MSDQLERDLRSQTEAIFERLPPIEDLFPEDMAREFGVEQTPVGTTTLKPAPRRRVHGLALAAATAFVALVVALPMILRPENPPGQLSDRPDFLDFVSPDAPSTPDATRPGMIRNPDNGHHYEAIVSPEALDWADARADAESRSLDGVQGHLATITSEEEDLWFRGSFGDILDSGPWLGGFQPEGSPEPAGNWQWVTGEPFDYTNWGDGEPNDGGVEQCLQYLPDPPVWNDFPCGAGPGAVYVVEYDTDIIESALSQPILEVVLPEGSLNGESFPGGVGGFQYLVGDDPDTDANWHDWPGESGEDGNIRMEGVVEGVTTGDWVGLRHGGGQRAIAQIVAFTFEEWDLTTASGTIDPAAEGVVMVGWWDPVDPENVNGKGEEVIVDGAWQVTDLGATPGSHVLAYWQDSEGNYQVIGFQ